MTDFTTILSGDYQNFEYFKDEVLMKIFGNFDDSTAEDDYIRDNDSLREAAEAANIKAIRKTGNIEILGSPLEVFEIIINSKSKISRSRIGIQNVVRRQLQTMGNAFMVFRYENPENRSWRFSFLQKGSSQKDSTTAKRYTYVFGREYNPRTANERFNKLSGKVDENGDSLVGDADLEEAFSVEALSDEFFAKYKCIYANFVQYITGKRIVKTTKGWAEMIMHQPAEILYAAFNHDDKRIRDYVKKLMGRIIFLYFVQKKGWFNNDLNYLQHLFENTKYQDDFLDCVLEPFFYTVLNTEPQNREDAFDAHNQNLKSSEVVWDKDLLKQWKDFPFLNGGLFERDENDIVRSKFPPQFFENNNGYDENFVGKIPTNGTEYTWEKIPGIFDLFAQYNFTIDENDPEDAEVGIDPEMLGKIFENLLEDNKDKGAFYTPKEIVQYMCRESLIAYLQTDAKDDAHKERIRQFVTTHDASILQNPEFVRTKIREVKICDPAIGSGAFPMGMLNELVLCTQSLDFHLDTLIDIVAIKKHIIQNSIYGVDIERGAIDIARLRFWLSLVIDEKEPLPLPNLDYKIMQGNSLLEQFDGIDLSKLTQLEKYQGEGFQTTIFGSETDIERRNLQNLITQYYYCKNHSEKTDLKYKIENNIHNQLKINKLIDTLDEIDIEGNQCFFLWHTWFSDAFENGGFDIVIGNPPYGADIDKQTKVLAKVYPETSKGFKDIYKYFFNLAFQLIKNKGLVCLITPNTFLRQPRYADLRRLILKYKILQIIDLGENVFNAVVPVAVSLVNGKQHNILFADLTKAGDVKQALQNVKFREIKQSEYEKTPGNIFVENVRQKSTNEYSLEDILDFKDAGINYQRVNVGLKSKGKSDLSSRLLYEGSKSAKNDVEYWKGIDINEYYIVDKTNRFCRTDIKLFDNERVILNKEFFKIAPKLIWRQTAPYPICAVDERGIWFGRSIQAGIIKRAFIEKVSYEYICGLLNSKYLRYLYNQNVQESGRVFPQVKLEKLKPLPIIIADNQKPIVDLVEKIIDLKMSNSKSQTKDLESEIDKLVYQLYGLSDEEIKIVEDCHSN